MKNRTKWILAGILILTIPFLNCKIIGVEENPTMVITVTFEHTFRTIYPGNDPHTHVFNPADYWNSAFDDWEIESSDLSDIQVEVWDVQPAELGVSAKFKLYFTKIIGPPDVAVNQLIGSTQTITLAECIAAPMTVFNNKVTINAAGKTALLNAIQAKNKIELSAPVENVSGNCDFWTKAVVKVQLHLKQK